MNRKRIIFVLLSCVAAAALLLSCGNNVPQKMEGNGPMTLFLSQHDEWLNQLEQACADAAAANGYTLDTVDAKGNADKQIKQIKKAAKKGEGAFLVNLVDPSRADEVIKAAGIRDVVFLNRAPDDLSVLDDTHIYVGCNESEAGELQGQVLAEYFQSEGMDDVTYLMLSGPTSLQSSSQRGDAVVQTIADAGHTMIPACEPLVCDYDRDSAREAVSKQLETMLTGGMAWAQIDCILSANDAMALGAIEAIEESGDPLPIVVGVDGTDDALAAVRDGKLLMTAYQDAERMADIAVSAANNLNHGEGYDAGISSADRIDNHIFWISFQSITQDNVGELLAD